MQTVIVVINFCKGSTDISTRYFHKSEKYLAEPHRQILKAKELQVFHPPRVCVGAPCFNFFST